MTRCLGARFTLTTLVLFLLMGSCSREQKGKVKEGLIPTFELDSAFEIELIAAEPLISDPVDMEIDEHGRLFVVEMHGYPLDKSGSGKIKRVIDSNGDGIFDKSEVFAEGLVLPNSIMRWKKGFIVTDAPNVLYFEDTDDDGRADKRDTLLTGFALSNPQHNLNSPVLGIDNWIYLAHEGAVGTETYKAEFGDRGAEIHYPGHSGSPRLSVNAGGRSVRFQPGQHTLEMTASHSQFGHTFDTWGHHLQVGNANHIYQEVIAERYLKRNPGFLISDATQSISDHGEAAEVFPITENPQHQLLTDIGVITSACGLHAYLGGAFNAPYDSVIFVAEPVSNLVHVDRISDDRSVYRASRINPHREFLASTDPKFRPVNLYTGPDGALYVVDYYRQIIEHPEWMGDDVVRSGALYNDSDKGRIYRIRPKGKQGIDWIGGLQWGDASADSLVARLSSSNNWWRMNAQRLLIDRQDKSAIDALRKLAKDPARPLGRLHALWTLQGMNSLSSHEIRDALQDPVAGIRENAIQLAELHLENNPEVAASLIAMQDDPDAKVRFQLLCTLGFLRNESAGKAREKLLLRDIDDPWVQQAALTVYPEEIPKLLSLVISRFDTKTPAYGSLLRKLTAMIGASGDVGEISKVLKQAFSTSGTVIWTADALGGIAQGIEDRDDNVRLSLADQNKLIDLFFSHSSLAVSKAAMQVLKASGIADKSTAEKAVNRAIMVARDIKTTEERRSAAIDFISIRDPKPHASLLMDFIDPTQPLPLQLASLRSLSAIPDTTVCAFLLKKWPVLTPELRDAGVNAFLEDDIRIAILLKAIEGNKIKTTEISWPRKVGLMAQWNKPLRDRARILFTTNTDSTVNASYAKAITLKGDVTKGKAIYQQQCALCHQIRGAIGIDLGPDLGTIHNWSREAIMANILAPNKSISSGYELWSVDLKNGESIQGLIASETPVAITLKNQNGWQKTVRREEIRSMNALNMSIMPEGLDKLISLEEMGDLLAYLKANK